MNMTRMTKIWFKPQKYLEVTQQVLTVRPTHNRDVFRGSLEERVEKGDKAGK